MVAIAITIASTLVQYLSILLHLPEGLILGRSLTALMSPLADACLLLYVQETSPVSIRGTASFFCEIGYGMMCVLGSVSIENFIETHDRFTGPGNEISSWLNSRPSSPGLSHSRGSIPHLPLLHPGHAKVPDDHEVSVPI